MAVSDTAVSPCEDVTIIRKTRHTTGISIRCSIIMVDNEKEVPFFNLRPEITARTISPIRNGIKELTTYPIESERYKLAESGRS